MTKYKRIGVLTSGGDAPGMNAAVRAVVRAGLYNKMKVSGIKHGYDGLIKGEFVDMESKDVSNIIHRGGTIIKSARSADFFEKDGRYTAYRKLIEAGIEALIVIGGDGTFTGARIFGNEFDFPVIGIPGTIDNDLYGTDMTIGYDTALNTVVYAVDKIRDTASSHGRLFFVEVMGRDVGFIALRAGIASGAEAVFIPETETKLDNFKQYLYNGENKEKTSNICIVAEGDEAGGAFDIAGEVKKHLPGYDIKVTILGHIQRGGSPSAFDRYLASKLGIASVEALLEDQRNIMVGLKRREVDYVPLSKTIKHHKAPSQTMIDMLDILNF
ncbi:MAG: 6-phosphofructokinase [Bacteroidota bacterium]|nr:6-phosphofructokinase [Bacteroidota bacterium]